MAMNNNSLAERAVSSPSEYGHDSLAHDWPSLSDTSRISVGEFNARGARRFMRSCFKEIQMMAKPKQKKRSGNRRVPRELQLTPTATSPFMMR